MKKQWYIIESECIKYNPSLTCKVGEKTVVAKVKSYGLAYAVAQAIAETLGESFSITIK